MRKTSPIFATLAVAFLIGLVGLLTMPGKSSASNAGPTDAFTSVSQSISGGSTLYTPPSGKKFTIKSMVIASSVAGVVVFSDNTTPILSIYLPANTNLALGEDFFGNGLRSTTADNPLKASLSSSTLTFAARIVAD